ncbi:MAG: hypothetical protein AB7J19_15640 [Beijerinckiaceae bacterium]
MLVSDTLELQDARVVREIGRISAASGWHGHSSQDEAVYRNRALDALIMLAKDFEADAIIGVDFSVDGASAVDLAEVPVERISVSGIAVKLARAA